ncbi:MAG: hypothetical protein AAF416_17350 [Pseudomonadota bacterium]
MERFSADAGYQRSHITAAAPRPVNIVKLTDPGFVVQAKRVRTLSRTCGVPMLTVEQTFAWITIKRRLAKDFERFAATVQMLIQIAMIKLMSRHIARYRTF